MVNAIQTQVEQSVRQLQESLVRQGFREDAEAVEALFARRIIWDQMASNLSAYVGTFLQKSNVPTDIHDGASALQRLLQPYAVSEHDKLFYEPARRLGKEIEADGFLGWSNIIEEEIKRGFGSGEIFDGLRHQFDKFLNETAEVPPQLQRKIRRFVSELS